MPMRQCPRFHLDKFQPGHSVELSCPFLCVGTAATPWFRPGWFGALELFASAELGRLSARRFLPLFSYSINRIMLPGARAAFSHLQSVVSSRQMHS
jgi:hypothetical protein